MKKLLGVLLAIMVAFTLVACNNNGNSIEPSQEEDTSLQVGIVLPTRDETRWLQDEASFSEILGKAGFTSEILFSQGSSEIELQNVESLIKQGVKVLVICPHDASAAVHPDFYLRVDAGGPGRLLLRAFGRHQHRS